MKEEPSFFAAGSSPAVRESQAMGEAHEAMSDQHSAISQRN